MPSFSSSSSIVIIIIIIMTEIRATLDRWRYRRRRRRRNWRVCQTTWQNGEARVNSRLHGNENWQIVTKMELFSLASSLSDVDFLNCFVNVLLNKRSLAYTITLGTLITLSRLCLNIPLMQNNALVQEMACTPPPYHSIKIRLKGITV